MNPVRRLQLQLAQEREEAEYERAKQAAQVRSLMSVIAELTEGVAHRKGRRLRRLLRQVDVAKEDAPTWSVACIDSTWSTRRIQEACGR